MLLLLIPIVWLAILTVFVALCHAAAQGDAQLAASAAAPSGPIGLKLLLSGAPAPPTASARRPHRRQTPQRIPATARRRRVAAHSGR
ncbi:MAG TPA: hypothetical protein VHW67_11350 [Solirubrobacteraceae bacterium]|jgi:hypothetical protein|nr:hypothetical protein [Solirubrobacteraceae bacterium]